MPPQLQWPVIGLSRAMLAIVCYNNLILCHRKEEFSVNSIITTAVVTRGAAVELIAGAGVGVRERTIWLYRYLRHFAESRGVKLTLRTL